MFVAAKFQSQRLPIVAALALLFSPAFAVFVSSNIVNAGNLAFNVIFSRWMGPELFGDLALLLTIKLALLGVMGAIQMAVSQMIAGTSGSEGARVEQGLARINRVLFVALWLCLPVAASLILTGSIGARLGLAAPHLLVILIAALPFSAPLSILRGVAFGQSLTNRVVLSAIIEMVVRLLGALVAWKAGFGIEGVVAAIALSIVAGWLVLLGVLPRTPLSWTETRPLARTLAIGALPLALLQISQVLALDGDIFLASAALPSREAGLVAALSLFQRIQFFACFTLASVLMPSIVGAVRDGRSILVAAMPVGFLFLAVAVPMMIVSNAAPELIIALLVGPEFSGAAKGLPLAALASVAFTMSYLLATLLAAIGDRRGLYAAAIAALVQLGLMAIAVRAPEAGFLDLLTIKAALQAVLAAGLLFFTVRRIGQTPTDRPL